jgi:DNA-directed RNA polymerase specialized sigma24 family protein
MEARLENKKHDKKPAPQILCPRSSKMTFTGPLHSCIGELSEGQRLVLHLRYWEKLEIAEIAEITGLVWDEVDQQIEVTLSEIRDSLAQLGQIHMNAAHAA